MSRKLNIDTERVQTDPGSACSEDALIYRSIAENSPNIIITANLDLKITFINRSMPVISDDNTIGMSVFELAPKDMNDILEEKVEQVRRFKIAAQLLAKTIVNEEDYWLDIRIGPLLNNNELMGYIFILNDITAWRKAELKAKESEFKHKSLFDAADFSIWYVNAKGDILDLNLKAIKDLKEMGYGFLNRENLIGKSLPDILGKKQGDEELIRIKKCIDRARTISFEDKTLYPKGWKWFKSSYTPVKNSDALVVGSQIIQSDISDLKNIEFNLKESEIKYRELVEISPDGIAAHKNGIVVFANKGCAKILGYDYSEDLIGIRATDFVHPDFRELSEERIRKSFGSGVMAEAIEEKFLRKDGSMVDVEVVAIPIQYFGEQAMQIIFRDISARKESERRLRESEMNYKQIVENMNDIIIKVDSDLKLTFASPGYIDMISANQKSDQDLTIFSGVHTEDLHVLRKAMDRVFESPYKSGYEIRMNSGSEWKWMEWSNKAIFDDYGNIKEILGVGRDIDEWKKAKEKLRESEESYRTLVENSEQSIFSIDENGKYLFINSYSAKKLGRSPDQIIGMQIHDLFPKDIANRQLEYIKKVFNSRERQVIESESVVMGEKRWYEVYMNPVFDSSGNVTSVFCILNDKTERKNIEDKLKKSEIRFRTLVEQMNEGMIRVDNDDIIQYVNQRMCELLGYESNELIGKRGYDTIIFEEDRELIKRKNLERLSEVSEQYEIRMRKKSGEAIWFLMSASPILNQEGIVTGSMSICSDITDNIRNREALEISESRYRNVVEQINDALIIDDTHGTITFANQRFYNLFGLDPKTDNNIVLEDYVAPEWIDLLRERHNKRVRGDKADSHFEYEGIKKNGERIWLEVDVTLIKDIDGKITGTQSAVRDISKRKIAESALKDSERKYRSLFATTRDGIAVYDVVNDGEDFIISNMNPAGENIANVKLIEIKGKSILDVFPAASELGLIDALKKAWKDNSYEFLPVNNYNDGRINLWMENKIFRISNAVIAVFIDVTKRKIAEDSLRETALFAEVNPYPTLRFDSDLKVSYLNMAARNIFNIEEAKHIALNDIFPDIKNKKFEKVLESGTTYTFETFRNNRAYLFTVKGLKDKKAGHIYGAEITVQKKIQEDLTNSRKLLESFTTHLQNVREEERLSIAREIHDELAQILSALKIFVSTIKSKILPADKNSIPIKDDLVNIEIMIDKAVANVRKVIKNLRPEVLEDFGLLEAIKILVDEFRNNTTLECAFEFSVDDLILEKSGQIAVYRICQEALTNISRHSNASRVEFNISQKKENYFFSIRDNGKGFLYDDLSLKEKFGIIGMKERATASGGEFHILSEVNKGTEITILVPVKQA